LEELIIKTKEKKELEAEEKLKAAEKSEKLGVPKKGDKTTDMKGSPTPMNMNFQNMSLNPPHAGAVGSHKKTPSFRDKKKVTHAKKDNKK
jgi:hypothetical protein